MSRDSKTELEIADEDKLKKFRLTKELARAKAEVEALN